MKLTHAPILFLLFAISVFAAEGASVAVAKVDFSEIDDLLTVVVLNKAGNEELRERYNQKTQAAKDAQEKMQKAMMEGKPFDPREAALRSMHDDADKKKVEQLCQKQLLELIEQTFEGKYDLIFKDDYRSSLIYSKTAIDDVTVIVKQELLKAIPEK